MQNPQAAPTADLDTADQSNLIKKRLGAFGAQATAPMPAAPSTVPLAGGQETVPLAPIQTAPIQAASASEPTPINAAATVQFTPPSPPTMPFASAPSSPSETVQFAPPQPATVPFPPPAQDATVPFAQPTTAQFSVPNAAVPGETGGLNSVVVEQQAATVPFASQTAPMPSQTGTLTAPIGAAQDPTVPFPGGTQPMPTGAPSMQPTVPIGADQQTAAMATGAFAQAVGNNQTMPMANTADFGTAGFNGQTNQMAGNVTGSITGSTSEMYQTGDFDGPGDYTLALTGGKPTAQFELEREITILRERQAAAPHDPDVLFELALALNELGNRVEAESCLQRLIGIYEQAGDEAQAARIRGMLGEAGTHQISSSNEATQRMTGQTTEHFKQRTGTLSLKNAAVRDGRVAVKERVEEREVTIFRARDVAFWDGLGEPAMLSADARPFWEDSEASRAKGKYRAAIDSLEMAIAYDPTTAGLYLRLAELQLKLGYRRKALATIQTLQQYESLFRSGTPEWVFNRLRVHAEPFDLGKVQALVDYLIADGKSDLAAPYAARLIDQFVKSDRLQDASEYANRICAMVPGNTQTALEASILELRGGDRQRARERWEFALRNGADGNVAKAAVAAMIGDISEAEHWRLLSEVLPVYREQAKTEIADAYQRTASVIELNSVTRSGSALFFLKQNDPSVRGPLASAAGDRSGSPVGRAAAAAILARILQQNGRGGEYLAAIRTTLTLFNAPEIPQNTNWHGLLGFEPSVVDLSFELGQELMKAGDAAGAVEVLNQGYQLDKSNADLNLALADAQAKSGQVGFALTTLDELAMSYRKAGKLEEMAAVLRQMSQLAPSNIKVKSRLVDAYLQRGFVAEARAELIQRADLEEVAGLRKEAIVSLQRAADLSWNLGYPQEAFNLYDRILAIDPEDVGNRSALVNLLLQVGRLSDAAEHQRAVVDLAIKNGRKHEAIAALHQVIGLTPDDMTAYYQLAENLASMAEYHQAEKVYRRIVLMNPDDAVAAAKATSMAALREQAQGGKSTA